ncbi:hypothetical protein V8F33_011149 [Rhypophila sp. PSN 637]
MPRPRVSHCTLDVDLVRELRPSERLISWIQRVEDFEPPVQDQTETVHPNTPSQNGTEEKRPSTPESRTIAQSDTRSVTLSRSRYCPSLVKAESDHDQDRDAKSVITPSRSHTLSSRPKTPKRPASLHVQKESCGSASPTSPKSPSKQAKAPDNTRTPIRRTRKKSVLDDSPVGAPRNLVPPQSQGSRSLPYSQPLSPSRLHRRATKRVLLIPAPAPSARRIDDDVSIPLSVLFQVSHEPKSKPEDDDFEDELEVLREQEEEERRLRAPVHGHPPNSAPRIKHDPEVQVKNDPYGEEYIDDELEALLIQEQQEEYLADDLEQLLIREQEEEENQEQIILVPRTEEEYRQLQQRSSPWPSPEPRPSNGNFISLYEVWSRALEESHTGNDKAPQGNGSDPISTINLLAQITNLENAGKLLSPSFPQEGAPCQVCDQSSTFGRVSASNPNGNAHRPFYKCIKCDKFITWADLGGVLADNPECDCAVGVGRRAVLPSRMTATGKRAASGPGRVFYTCAEARCDFWQWRAGDDPTGPGRDGHRGRW